MIIVKNRELLIPNNERYIGTTYDTETENRIFQVPRYSQRGVDLAALTFRLDIQYANESYDTIVLDKEIGEAFVILIWRITSSTLQVPGTMYIGLRAVDNEATVKWSSFSAAMYVERHLNTPGNYGGGLTEIEQMEQDHQYMKGVVNELKANLDYAHDAEAWAQGTRSGTAVPSTDKTYQKNSKYYSEQANASKNAAANSATAAAGSATAAHDDSEAVAASRAQIAQNASNIAIQTARIDQFTHLAEGSTTGDAELMDARVGADGVTYTSAGAATRANDSLLKSQIEGTTDGYQYFNPSLSANSGVGQDWNVEYVQNLPIGTEVEVIFFGYTGTDLTRFMIVGIESDNTATNIASTNTNQKWTYKFKTAKNFAKLRFNLRRSQNQQSVSMAYMVKADIGDALGHDIYALYNGINTLDTTLTDVQHATPISAVTPTYTKVNNVYILRDSTIRTGTDYYMTSAFLVPQGKSLWFNSQMPNANAYGRITEWTEQGEYVGYVWSPTTSDEVSHMYTPDHDAYVKLCGYGTLAFDAKIVADNEPGMGIVLNAMLSNMVNVKEIYPMYGIKWDVMGDSLTNKDSVGQSSKNYVDWIAQSNGLDANNVAVGGKDWWNGFLAEVSNIRNTTDIVTIFGSFNEIGSVTSHIGTLSDAPSASGSFCARAKNIFNSIYAVKNDVKIGVITPTPWVNLNPYDTDSTTQEGIENFISALKSLCAMYSIPVLDLYHESMMRPWDETFRNTYYRQTVVDGQTVGDGVHPNALGHKLYLAPKIEAFMRTMIREYSA